MVLKHITCIVAYNFVDLHMGKCVKLADLYMIHLGLMAELIHVLITAVYFLAPLVN